MAWRSEQEKLNMKYKYELKYKYRAGPELQYKKNWCDLKCSELTSSVRFRLVSILASLLSSHTAGAADLQAHDHEVIRDVPPTASTRTSVLYVAI